jgi:hypothetical protein
MILYLISISTGPPSKRYLPKFLPGTTLLLAFSNNLSYIQLARLQFLQAIAFYQNPS